MKKQNPIAKDLRTPKYKKRVVKDKTKYDRKNDKRQNCGDYQLYKMLLYYHFQYLILSMFPHKLPVMK